MTRAVRFDRYGDRDALYVADVELPPPPAGEVIVEVRAAGPGRVFEFAVVIRERQMNKWRYEFRPTEHGGTDVTESFDLGDNLVTKVWRPLGGVMRERRNQRDMLRTLERVKIAAERS